MKIGILVNTDKYMDAVIGLTNSALSKGHEVAIFAMDDGTRLLEEPAYTGLCSLDRVRMSYCDHSAKSIGIDRAGIPDGIVCGSQYNNADMIHNSDRVIVL